MFTHFFDNDFFQLEFFGNNVYDYLVSLLAFFISLLVLKIVQMMVFGRLKKLTQNTKSDVDDTLIKVFESVKPQFYWFLAFYFAIRILSFDDLVRSIVAVVLIVWVVYQVAVAIQIFVDYVIDKKFEKKETEAKSAISLIKLTIKIFVWSLGFLFVLSNLGVDITTFIAGLGVGGIAIAFALQNILGDLFSSFAIFFDKPFQEGDYIVVGDKSGTVEKIGIKTTRVRALQGEEIVFSNQELTTAQVQNFKKLQKRRISFTLGVTYDTPSAKMKKISSLVETAIDRHESTEFDRVFFTAFGESALLFEVVYFVRSPEYSEYLAVNEKILYEIKEKLEKLKIEIAFPTQTVFLRK